MSKIMKYFTPELLARFRSADDDVADAAAEEWARAQARYERYLKDHREDFTRGVRALLDGPSLHDAAIVQQSQESDAGCTLALRLGDGLGDLMVLGYVGGEARTATSPLKELADDVSPPRVLYDEVLVTGRTAGRVGFCHNLLCTGGLMIRCDFTDVFATRLDPSHPRPAADKRPA